MKQNSFYLIAIAAAAVLNIFLIYSVLFCGKTFLYEENNLIENMQAILFAGSFILLAVLGFGRSGVERVIVLFLSVICLTCFLREVDVERFSLPKIIVLLGSGMGRNLMLAAMFVLLFIFSYRLRAHISAALRSLLAKGLSVFIAGGIVCFIGNLFESLKRIFEYAAFMEEMTELNGAALVFLSAILFMIGMKKSAEKTAD